MTDFKKDKLAEPEPIRPQEMPKNDTKGKAEVFFKYFII